MGETFRANQLRLWLYSAAYVLMHALRRVGLTGTSLARACANTIRLRLLEDRLVVSCSPERAELSIDFFMQTSTGGSSTRSGRRR